jgi:RNA polymerase sigma-70 factor, ECF subfamily
VHRATAARWVAKAHSTLNTRVRKEMVERLRVSEKELTSILRLIDSQLHITLDRYLNKTENA